MYVCFGLTTTKNMSILRDHFVVVKILVLLHADVRVTQDLECLPGYYENCDNPL